jgi:hypothetical protein
VRRLWFPFAVVVAAGLVVLWIATRPLDPRGTVEEFFSAWRRGDTDAHLAYVSAGSAALDRRLAKRLGRLPDDLRIGLGNAKVDHDTAQVPVTVIYEVTTEFGELATRTTEPVMLVREQGKWKVDLMATLQYQSRKRGISADEIVSLIEESLGWRPPEGEGKRAR